MGNARSLSDEVRLELHELPRPFCYGNCFRCKRHATQSVTATLGGTRATTFPCSMHGDSGKARALVMLAGSLDSSYRLNG